MHGSEGGTIFGIGGRDRVFSINDDGWRDWILEMPTLRRADKTSIILLMELRGNDK